MAKNLEKTLKAAIEDKEALVGIIGLGYVGLPLVRAFCKKKFRVLGFDIDPEKVKKLRQGKSYIKHIPSAFVKKMTSGGSFEATDDFSRLNEADAIIICVPTPLKQIRGRKIGPPDISFIRNTARDISKTLRRGQLVILESTTYPGTTEEVLLPILEKSGLAAGKDFFLAYSPEREDPGNPKYTTATIPKVVGGFDRQSERLASLLYSKVVTRVVHVSGMKEAEACKMLENIYRAVNIALVNELKILFEKMDIDIWEVIRAASTKPFGFHPFYPGPGPGGHCIPTDPFYLSWKARQYGFNTRFIKLAGLINEKVIEYVIERLAQGLKKSGKRLKGAGILILGMAYKKNVGDMRESPSLKLAEVLIGRGAKVCYNDPHIPQFSGLRAYDFSMKSKRLTAKLLESQDAVIIAADHDDYDYTFIVRNARLVIDTRNATRNVKICREKIVRA